MSILHPGILAQGSARSESLTQVVRKRSLNEKFCSSVGRGACTRHTRLCGVRSPVSIQSWSTKRAWSGGLGHWTVNIDKVTHTRICGRAPDCATFGVYFNPNHSMLPFFSVCDYAQLCSPAAFSHHISSCIHIMRAFLYSLIAYATEMQWVIYLYRPSMSSRMPWKQMTGIILCLDTGKFMHQKLSH